MILATSFAKVSQQFSNDAKWFPVDGNSRWDPRPQISNPLWTTSQSFFPNTDASGKTAMSVIRVVYTMITVVPSMILSTDKKWSICRRLVRPRSQLTRFGRTDLIINFFWRSRDRETKGLRALLIFRWAVMLEPDPSAFENLIKETVLKSVFVTWFLKIYI